MMPFKKFKQLFVEIRETKETLDFHGKKLDEIYWSSVFNSSIAGSKWLINTSFNPGRWAAGYPMLYILFRIYNDIHPKNILEFGLGESTKLAYQYHSYFPNSTLKIIEQDEKWLQFFSNEIYDVISNTSILEIEKIKIQGQEVFQYQALIASLPKQKYDLIIIDGPWGSEHYSRYQIIDLLEEDLIASQFIIIMDDYERAGEKQTIAKLKESFNKKGIQYEETIYSGIKETYLICSKNYKFLTSL